MTNRTAGIVALIGLLGWGGLIWLGIQLYVKNPPTAAFDLELLLRAGRSVAAGHSPYDPAMLAGAAPVAERLFYSYPPVVAQLMALVAAIPSPVMFVAWTAAAVGGLAFVARALAIRLGSPLTPNLVAATTVAIAPLVFPFAIGLLFGNLDVFFPLVFGLVLLGVIPPASTGNLVAAGAATTLATLAKLHPGSIGLWLLARSLTGSEARRIVIAAIATLVAVVGVSVAVVGAQAWIDYAAVVRAGSGADLVDPRNAGPAAQIALLVGGGGAGAETLARTLQIPVTILALVVTVIAALRVTDPVESLAWAVAASLVVLPVTWYHYPSAMIPFAVVAVLRSANDERLARRVRWTVLTAGVVAAAAISWLPLTYAAIGLIILAARQSRPLPSPVRVPDARRSAAPA